MFKHGDHKHETVQEARDCDAGTNVRTVTDPQPGTWQHTARYGVPASEDGEAQSDAEPAPDFVSNPATDPQLSYLDDLIVSRDDSEAPVDVIEILMHRMEGKLISFPEAKRALNFMTKAPRKANATETKLRDGIYRNPTTGELFKLQFNRASGDGRQLYAKQAHIFMDLNSRVRLEIPLTGEKLGEIAWEYAGKKPLAFIKPEWAMTAEEASAFGALYGECVFCHLALTDERSIAVGYGEKCASNHSLPWG